MPQTKEFKDRIIRNITVVKTNLAEGLLITISMNSLFNVLTLK